MVLTCVCGQTDFCAWKHPKIVECLHCGVLRVHEINESSYTAQYTAGTYHAEGSVDLPHATAGREPHATRYASDVEVAEKRIAKLRKFAHEEGMVLIDVGCANGAFMNVAIANGFDAYGVDLSKDAVHIDLRDRVRVGDLAHVGFQRRTADVITFNDSLEHFIDPVAALKAARGILKRDGILVLDIPDMGCADALEKGEAFHHVKPAEHIWYFTANELRALLEREGFYVIWMDVPVPGKVTAYAMVSSTVEEVTVFGPPGIGDILWTLHKLPDIVHREQPCKLTYVVCCDGDRKMVTRAKEFMQLCPYIHAVDFRPLLLPPDNGCPDPSEAKYNLIANDFLDPKVEPFQGQMLETWRPELPHHEHLDSPYRQWLVPIPDSALQTAHLRLADYPKYAAVYLSSMVWNNTIMKPVWTPRHWAELLIRINDAGTKPVLIGAGWDEDYAKEVAVEILNMEREPAKVWINTIGRTPIALTMAYMRLAAVTIGPCAGVVCIAGYFNWPSIVFWPVQKISKVKAQFTPEFGLACVPPESRVSGLYTPMTIGTFTVDDVYNEVTRKVKGLFYETATEHVG